jgi:asparagine synthase (glutamine-hydrolysing)
LRLQPELSKLSYDDAVRLVRNLLEESCRCHLVADVPVGSFLSGGVDSTAITAIMAQYTAGPVKSFSVGFEESTELKHELVDARLAASHIGTDHTEVIVTGRDAEDAFEDLVRTIDQPSYDGANTYFVSRAASTSVKVALSGLGGDELFAGYGHFFRLQYAAGRGPRGFDNFVEMLHRLRPNRVTATAAETSALRRLTMVQRYAQLRRGLTDPEIHGAMADSLLEHFSSGFMEGHIGPLLSQSQNSVTQTSLIECRQYLLNTLLRDADALSMGHGLEVRPALLDHRLVEHALALPSDYKLAGGRQKAVFKDAVADILPPALLTRPKTGFTLPMWRWLRNELRPRLLAVLNGSTARSLFKPTFLGHCLKSIDLPQSGRTLWTLLILVSWVDEFKVRLEL